MLRKLGVLSSKTFSFPYKLRGINSWKSVQNQICHPQIFGFSNDNQTDKEGDNNSFEKVTNYHNLWKTILSINNPEEIMTIYKNNEQMFQDKDYLFVLKMVSKNMNDDFDYKKNKDFENLLNRNLKQIGKMKSEGLILFFLP